jgi:hypothetical protein
MRRFFGVLVVIVTLGVLSSSCTNNNITAPTLVAPVLTTDSLTGSLTTGGVMYHLVSAKTGSVTMQMKGIGPDPAQPLGMQIGVYSTLSCTGVIDNPAATIGSTLVGLTTASTSLCVKVYDPGSIPADTSVTYEIAITYYK